MKPEPDYTSLFLLDGGEETSGPLPDEVIRFLSGEDLETEACDEDEEEPTEYGTDYDY